MTRPNVNMFSRPLLLCVALGSICCYAVDLPPGIQADLYLVQAERQIQAGQSAAAVATLDKILALQRNHGLEIPVEFWFKHAEASLDAELFEKAVTSATQYLRTAGRDGEWYMEALQVLGAAELGKESTAAALAAVPEMMRIRPGSFWMGCVPGIECERDEDKRFVRISQAFEISRYEITFAQWDACVAQGGCNGYRPDDMGWGRGNRPVINVNMDDVKSYLAWLYGLTGHDYRLPSEAEWEYAGRAGSTTAYSWGNEIGRNRANCDGCGSQWDNSQTAPVGSFAPNAWGLYDMHGNVTERVGIGSRLCGGSWHNSPKSVGSASRQLDGNSDSRFSDTGFRVARTLTP